MRLNGTQKNTRRDRSESNIWIQDSHSCICKLAVQSKVGLQSLAELGYSNVHGGGGGGLRRQFARKNVISFKSNQISLFLYVGNKNLHN